MKRLTPTFAGAIVLVSFCPSLHAGSRVPPVASYRIEASVDAEHRLTGRETVTFVNRTQASYDDLQLHLYLNGFLNDRSTWMREARSGRGREQKPHQSEAWFGSTELNRVTLADGTDLTSGIRFIGGR